MQLLKIPVNRVGHKYSFQPSSLHRQGSDKRCPCSSQRCCLWRHSAAWTPGPGPLCPGEVVVSLRSREPTFLVILIPMIFNDPHFVWGHISWFSELKKPSSLLYYNSTIIRSRNGSASWYPILQGRNTGFLDTHTVWVPCGTSKNAQWYSMPEYCKTTCQEHSIQPKTLSWSKNNSSFPICLDYGLLLINMISVIMTYYDYPFDVMIHIIWI